MQGFAQILYECYSNVIVPNWQYRGIKVKEPDPVLVGLPIE